MTRRKPAQSEKLMENQPVVEKPAVGLDRVVQSRIGQQLRAMYDDVVKEGVPDRFAELMKKLDLPPETNEPNS